MTDEEIKGLYQQGFSLAKAAELAGCSPATVKRAVLRAGGSMRKPTRPLGAQDLGPRKLRHQWATEVPEETRAEVVQRYAGGDGFSTLCPEFNIGSERIKTFLAEAGVPVRRRGGKRKLTDEKRGQILTAWSAGKSTTAIAIECGTSSETVKLVLADAGIEWENRLSRGPGSPSWKGGRIHYGPEFNGRRYAAVKVDEADPMYVMAFTYGYVPEHRLAMARSLGRPLQKHETVHHINGVRDDNRLGNLQLRMGRHGKGVVMQCLDCGGHNIEATEIADAS